MPRHDAGRPAPGRDSTEQSVHDTQVCSIARSLYQQGYAIAADGDCGIHEALRLPCFAQPILPGCEADSCRRPDVYAQGRGETLIIEVETPGTLSNARTRCQMLTFTRQRGRTIVYVPRGYSQVMQSNLRRWGVTGVIVREY
jgi:hypothetical protein